VDQRTETLQRVAPRPWTTQSTVLFWLFWHLLTREQN
jgi:hypothetical protein